MKYNPQRIITEWLQHAFQLKLRVSHVRCKTGDYRILLSSWKRWRRIIWWFPPILYYIVNCQFPWKKTQIEKNKKWELDSVFWVKFTPFCFNNFVLLASGIPQDFAGNYMITNGGELTQLVNPFFSIAPFLFLLKTSENLSVFWCFQGVEKGSLGTNGLGLYQ